MANLTAEFSQSRADAEKRAFLAETEGEIAQIEQATQQQAVAAEKAKAPSVPAKPSSTGFSLSREFGSEGIAETGRVVGGGVRDAAQAAVDLTYDVTDAITGTLFDKTYYTDQAGQKTNRMSLPEVAKPTSVSGGVGRSVSQFLLPFAGYMKALGGAKNMSTGVKAATAGAATDFSVFDPTEKRLSNLLTEWSADNSMQKELFEFMSGKDDGQRLTGRVKAALEGMALGKALEVTASTIMKGITKTREYFRAKGVDPAEALREAAKQNLDEVHAGKGEPTVQELHAKKLADAEALQARIAETTGTNKAPLTPKQKASKGKELNATVSQDKELADWFEFQAKNNEASIIAAREQARQRLIPQAQADEIIAKFEARQPRAYVSPEGGIKLSAGAPEDGLHLPLGDRVKAALEVPAFSRTADDLIALNAYKKLQESLFKDIIKVDTRAAGKLIPEGEAGAKQMADIQAAIQENNSLILAAAKETPTTAANPFGSDIVYLGSGPFLTPEQVIKVANATGRFAKFMVRDAQDAVGGTVGGVVGYNSADDNASFSDKMKLAVLGAGAGIGVAKTAKDSSASKVKEGLAVQDAQKGAQALGSTEGVLAREEGMNILSRPDLAGISSIAEKPARQVQIKAEKVTKLIEAAKRGDLGSLTKDLDTADFNFDHIDDEAGVEELMKAVSSVFGKEIDHAKAGVQSFGDIKKLADELGSGVGTLKELYGDTQNLAARVTAHRILLVASAKKTSEMARSAAFGDEASMLAFRKHVVLHASIQAKMKGTQTEIARALSSFRIKASHADLVRNEVDDLISGLGGSVVNREFAKKMASITDPAMINKAARRGAFARTNDAVYEMWVNSILSGPITHVANVLGNSMVAVGTVAERYSMAGIGKILGHMDGVTFAEANSYSFGMMEGLVDALKVTKAGMDALGDAAGKAGHFDFSGAKDVLRSNSAEFGNAYRAFATDAPVLDNAFAATKEGSLNAPAISGAALNLDGTLGAAADVLGTLVRTPGRFLTTADEIFKTVSYRGEMKAQAYRKARSEGLSGDALAQRVADLVESDGDQFMQATALTTARKNTFTTPMTGNMAEWQRALSHSPVGRYVVPFFRTPVNIIKHTFDRTPGINFLASENRRKWAAGGVERDEVLAKMAIGGTVYSVATMLADSGMIVGNLDPKNRTEAERLAGMTAYSFVVDGKYYAFNRTDPLGMFFGLAADFSKMYKTMGSGQKDDITAMMMTSLSNNLVSKSYLSGLIDIIEAFTRSEKSGDAWDKLQKKYASSFVPFSSLQRTVRREDDPVVRETWSIMDAVTNTLAFGNSKDLFPLRNVFGEETKYTGSLGPDIASPIYSSQLRDDDKATMEILKNNVDLQRPDKSFTAANGTPPVEFSPKQYDAFAKSAGEMFKTQLDKLVESPQYQALSDDQGDYAGSKGTAIRTLWAKSKEIAFKKLITTDPELMKQFKQEKQNHGNAMRGLPVFLQK